MNLPSHLSISFPSILREAMPGGYSPTDTPASYSPSLNGLNSWLKSDSNASTLLPCCFAFSLAPSPVNSEFESQMTSSSSFSSSVSSFFPPPPLSPYLAKLKAGLQRSYFLEAFFLLVVSLLPSSVKRDVKIGSDLLQLTRGSFVSRTGFFSPSHLPYFPPLNGYQDSVHKITQHYVYWNKCSYSFHDTKSRKYVVASNMEWVYVKQTRCV